MPLFRRPLTSQLGAILILSVAGSISPAPASDWQTIAPADAGFESDIDGKLDDAFAGGDLPNLHAVVVARHGKLVLERYYEGLDERWGINLGKVEFAPDVKHDLRSVSKSIVSLLYGIALSEGQVPSLDQPLVDQFPAYKDLRADAQRRRITVGHALTMTLGLEWDESLPYTDPRNSEIAMERADDRYHFVLSRAIVTDPGRQWEYNGGTTAVLAHLIARGTGTPLHDYARERLFRPLGIVDTAWTIGSNGEAAAASGLRMRPRDLAKIGQLVLNQGIWEGRQVVPRDWLEASHTTHAQADHGLEYGYQWWLGGRSDGQRWVAGFGNGGQRLYMIPALDLVVAVLAGNYNQRGAWKVAAAIIREILLPALRDR